MVTIVIQMVSFRIIVKFSVNFEMKTIIGCATTMNLATVSQLKLLIYSIKAINHFLEDELE